MHGVRHDTSRPLLQVDSDGFPRISWYSGSYAVDPFADHALYSLFCSTACTAAEAHAWGYVDMDLSHHPAGGVDLQFTRQDQPRVAYQELGGGLGYAWCNADCTGTSGVQISSIDGTTKINGSTSTKTFANVNNGVLAVLGNGNDVLELSGGRP